MAYTGTRGFTQILFPEGITVTSIASGLFDYMAVTADGHAYTFRGQEPIKFNLPSGFSAVRADRGASASCLVGLDGTVRCWGGYSGESGQGADGLVLIP